MTVRLSTPVRAHDFRNINALGVESVTGQMMLLPRHVDCTAALATGLMLLRDGDGGERYVGVDGGTLVKAGQTVMVSTPRVAMDEELGRLGQSLEAKRREREERGREARQALARLEVDLARSLFESEAAR